MRRSTSGARLASRSRAADMKELLLQEEVHVPAWARSGRTASTCGGDDDPALLLDYEEDDSYVDEAVGRAERAYSSRFWVFYRKRNVGFGFVYVDLLDIVVFFVLPALLAVTWRVHPEAATAAVSHVWSLTTEGPAKRWEASAHAALRRWGVPPPYPTAELVVSTTGAVLLAAGLYFVSFGRRHWERRADIEEQLLDARAKLIALEAKLRRRKQEERRRGREKEKERREKEEEEEEDSRPVRVFMEGAFDLMHYGGSQQIRACARGGAQRRSCAPGVVSSSSGSALL